MKLSFSAGCMLSIGLGFALAETIGLAKALSCVANERWELQRVSVAGPDGEADRAWPQHIRLDTPKTLDVWERNPETGGGGDLVLRGERR